MSIGEASGNLRYIDVGPQRPFHHPFVHLTSTRSASTWVTPYSEEYTTGLNATRMTSKTSSNAPKTSGAKNS